MHGMQQRKFQQLQHAHSLARSRSRLVSKLLVFLEGFLMSVCASRMLLSTSKTMVRCSVRYVDEYSAAAVSKDFEKLDPLKTPLVFCDSWSTKVSSFASNSCCCSWKMKCKRCLGPSSLASRLRISSPLPPSTTGLATDLRHAVKGTAMELRNQGFSVHHQRLNPSTCPHFVKIFPAMKETL